jgi:hypothetical protein
MSELQEAAAKLAQEHRRILSEFCKDPEKSEALRRVEEALERGDGTPQPDA